MSMIVKMIMMVGCRPAIGARLGLVFLFSEELVDKLLDSGIFVVSKSLSLSMIVVVVIALTFCL